MQPKFKRKVNPCAELQFLKLFFEFINNFNFIEKLLKNFN